MVEGCLLCLQNQKEYVDYIQVYSTQWLELKIHNIIEKHLWPIETIQPSSYICANCWNELYDFHKFFMTIKAAHNKRFALATDPQWRLPQESMDENHVNPEGGTDVKPIIEFQYETEILMEQNLSEARQRNIIPETILPNTFNNENENTLLKEEQETATTDHHSCVDLTNNIQDKNHSIEKEYFGYGTYNLDVNNRFLYTEQSSSKDSTIESVNSIEDTINQTGVYEKPINVSTNEVVNWKQYQSQFVKQISTQTKGKRGRPRKNLTEKLSKPTFTISSDIGNLSSSISTEHGYENDMSTKKIGRPAKDTQRYKSNLQQKQQIWFDKMSSRPERKRILPRKFLTSGFEITKNSIFKRTNKKLYSFAQKTGKRGRPRKILINNTDNSNNVLPLELTSPDIIGTLDQVQTQEHHIDNMHLKPLIKRGRPRKYSNNIEKNIECDESGILFGSTKKNKRGRPKKDESKYTTIVKLDKKKKPCSNIIISRPIRKRKLPHKYYTNDIEITERFLINNRQDRLDALESQIQNSREENSMNELSIDEQPEELCEIMPSTSSSSSDKRKYLTNDIENTEILNTETFTSESPMSITKQHEHAKPKLKIKRGRPNKGLMRNYIATSVRCMQIFKKSKSMK